MKPISFERIVASISSYFCTTCQLKSVQNCYGGDINQSYHLKTSCGDFFVKVNDSNMLWMFEQEAKALEEIAETKTIKVPKVVATGKDERKSWIILEYFKLTSFGDFSLLGQQLANLHQKEKPFFGWQENNTIGTVLQVNKKKINWENFFWENRLLPQLKQLQQNISRNIDFEINTLLECYYHFFKGKIFFPSLLHGDLWGGNIAFTEDGNPIIFDPASYYGDWEVDIAMTQLFGTLHEDFYQAYFSILPKQNDGYLQRVKLYNFYHILNHAQLFGGHYVHQSYQMLVTLMEIGKNL